MRKSVRPFDIIIATFVGLDAVAVVYIAFVAHEFVIGGRDNVAIGIAVLFFVAQRPLFLPVPLTSPSRIGVYCVNRARRLRGRCWISRRPTGAM